MPAKISVGKPTFVQVDEPISAYCNWTQIFSVVVTLNFVELFPEQNVVTPLAANVITGTAKLTFAISTPKII